MPDSLHDKMNSLLLHVRNAALNISEMPTQSLLGEEHLNEIEENCKLIQKHVKEYRKIIKI